MLLAEGRQNNVTVAELTVMVYYTPEFKTSVGGLSSVEDYVNTMMTETNQGYENSGILASIRVLCLEEMDIDEQSSASTMLNNFRTSKSEKAST